MTKKRSDARKRRQPGSTEPPSKKAKPSSKDDHVSPQKQKDDKFSVGDEKTWSKSKKKRMRTLMAKLKHNGGDDSKGNPSQQPSKVATSQMHPESAKDVDDIGTSTNGTSKKPSIRDAFKARLSGSRFRILNEE
ncbi:MAG: hypothetical protein SGARI_005378, partial [Bacillariaceae sp.]